MPAYLTNIHRIEVLNQDPSYCRSDIIRVNIIVSADYCSQSNEIVYQNKNVRYKLDLAKLSIHLQFSERAEIDVEEIGV